MSASDSGRAGLRALVVGFESDCGGRLVCFLDRGPNLVRRADCPCRDGARAVARRRPVYRSPCCVAVGFGGVVLDPQREVVAATAARKGDDRPTLSLSLRSIVNGMRVVLGLVGCVSVVAEAQGICAVGQGQIAKPQSRDKHSLTPIGSCLNDGMPVRAPNV